MWQLVHAGSRYPIAQMQVLEVVSFLIVGVQLVNLVDDSSQVRQDVEQGKQYSDTPLS